MQFIVYAYDVQLFNPITNTTETAIRSRIHIEYELPLGKDYAEMVTGLLVK